MSHLCDWRNWLSNRCLCYKGLVEAYTAGLYPTFYFQIWAKSFFMAVKCLQIYFGNVSVKDFVFYCQFSLFMDMLLFFRAFQPWWYLHSSENYISTMFLIMYPAVRVGRHIVFARVICPSVCLVCLSVRPSVCPKSCLLCNLKTIQDIFMKLHTNINQH